MARGGWVVPGDFAPASGEACCGGYPLPRDIADRLLSLDTSRAYTAVIRIDVRPEDRWLWRGIL